MKNIIILNNEKELINQIQVLLEEDRKSLETINGIIAETKKKTVTLSSYSNTFKYFKKNRNYILWLFYENNQSWLQIREIFENDQEKWINLIFQKMCLGKTPIYCVPSQIWVKYQTDKIIDYLIQQLRYK